MKKELDEKLVRQMAGALTLGASYYDRSLRWGWNPIRWYRNIVALDFLSTEIVVTVETVFKTLLSSMTAEERIDYAAELLDRLVPLPFILEMFDKKFFHWLINRTVNWLNEKYGHIWPLVTDSSKN